MPSDAPQIPFRKRPLAIGLLLAGALLAVGLVPLSLDARVRDRIYGAEGSIVEWASCIAWIALALVFPFVLRSRSRAVLAGSFVFLACAAREADLHIALTGYSVLKPRFLLDSSFPLGSRLIVACILAVLVTATVLSVHGFLRAAGPAGGLRAPWVRVAVATPVAAVLLKALDRIPALARRGIGDIDESLLVSLRAIEENFEFALPFGALVAARMYARARANTPATLPGG
ncbi:MAG: hypothetical protein ACKO0W_12915 [Planctomycetota bacterium]